MIDIFSSQVRSVVDLLRFDAGLRRSVNRILSKVQREIVVEIAAIDPAGPRNATVRTRRLRRLQQSVESTINTQFPRARDLMIRELRGLSEFEAARYARDVNASIGANIFDVTLTEAQLEAVVNNSMIEGNTVKQWWDTKERSFQDQFGARMRQATQDFQVGVIKGDSIGAIVSRVRGKLGYMKNVRRETEALVRTSTMTVANKVRFDMIEDNADIVDAVQVLATLDMRTTPICQSLDGLQWSLPFYEPIDHSQPLMGGPPFHWNCRSTLIPVTMSWEKLSGKGSKVSKTKMDKLDKLTRSERASLGKPTDRKTYQTWLKVQPKAIQDEVLGTKRADLWRRKSLTTIDLVDQTGRPLTLKQLWRRFGK